MISNHICSLCVFSGESVRGSPGLKISPGVSSFSAEPSAAAPYLEPLLTYAAERVPEALHAQTPLHVLATAGVRLLPPAVQSTLIESLREGLTLGTSDGKPLSPFPLVTARVVSGASEGFYAALSVNYLSGVVNASLHPVSFSLNETPPPESASAEDASSNATAAGNKAISISSKPLGALDLGGASTQMVLFQPPPKSVPLPAAAHTLPGVQIQPTAAHTPEECNSGSSSSGSVLCTTAGATIGSEYGATEGPSGPSYLHNDTAVGAEGTTGAPLQPLKREDFVAHSFLGFGADQVRERLWSRLAAGARSSTTESTGSPDSTRLSRSTRSSNSGTSESTSSTDTSTTVATETTLVTASNPCGFVGHCVSWLGATLVGTGDADACAEAVAELLLADGCSDSSRGTGDGSDGSDKENIEGTNGDSSGVGSGSKDVHSGRDCDASISLSNKQCRLGMHASQLPASLPNNKLVAMSVFFFATDCVRVLGALLANQAAERLSHDTSTDAAAADAAVDAVALSDTVAVAADIEKGRVIGTTTATAKAATAAAVEVARTAQNASNAMGAAWPSPSVHELASATSGFCRSAWSDVKAFADVNAHDWTWPHQMPHRCFEAVLVAQLLRHGVQVPLHARQVQFAVALQGMEVEWTLGLALSVFSGDV